MILYQGVVQYIIISEFKGVSTLLQDRRIFQYIVLSESDQYKMKYIGELSIVRVCPNEIYHRVVHSTIGVCLNEIYRMVVQHFIGVCPTNLRDN